MLEWRIVNELWTRTFAISTFNTIRFSFVGQRDGVTYFWCKIPNESFPHPKMMGNLGEEGHHDITVVTRDSPHNPFEILELIKWRDKAQDVEPRWCQSTSVSPRVSHSKSSWIFSLSLTRLAISMFAICMRGRENGWRTNKRNLRKRRINRLSALTNGPVVRAVHTNEEYRIKCLLAFQPRAVCVMDRCILSHYFALFIYLYSK